MIYISPISALKSYRSETFLITSRRVIASQIGNIRLSGAMVCQLCLDMDPANYVARGYGSKRISFDDIWQAENSWALGSVILGSAGSSANLDAQVRAQIRDLSGGLAFRLVSRPLGCCGSEHQVRPDWGQIGHCGKEHPGWMQTGYSDRSVLAPFRGPRLGRIEALSDPAPLRSDFRCPFCVLLLELASRFIDGARDAELRVVLGQPIEVRFGKENHRKHEALRLFASQGKSDSVMVLLR